MILPPEKRLHTFSLRKRVGVSGGFGFRSYGSFLFGCYVEQFGIWQMRLTRQGKVPVLMRDYRPTNPQTEAQQANRSKFADAMSAWSVLTTEEKSVYNKEAKKRGLYGVNLFIREYFNIKMIYSRHTTEDLIINNSDSFVAIPNLSFPVSANEFYIVDFQFIVITGFTPGAKISFNLPSGASFQWSLLSTGTTGITEGNNPFILTGAGDGLARSVFLRGLLSSGSSGGDFSLLFAQNVATPSDTILKSFSNLRAFRS